MILIHINDRECPFTEWIREGVKTVETRRNPSLRPLIGQRVGILQTGLGPARLVAFATITEERHYPSDYGVLDDGDAMILPGSVYARNPYGYVLSDVVPVVPVLIGAAGFTGNRTYRALPIEESACTVDANY